MEGLFGVLVLGEAMKLGWMDAGGGRRPAAGGR